jgi:hypothetical protein
MGGPATAWAISCAILHVYGLESISVRNLVLASLEHMKRISIEADNSVEHAAEVVLKSSLLHSCTIRHSMVSINKTFVLLAFKRCNDMQWFRPNVHNVLLPVDIY